MRLSDQLDQFYAVQKIPVVRDGLRFCHKLGIGEKAYAGLRKRENLRSTVEALGVGAATSSVMASSVVATAFFSSGGWLAALGLATAATPVGWVVGAGVAVGGGYLGIVKLLEQPKENGMVVIPKHINTPLDLLASTLLDFYIPLGLKFSWLDGHACEKEQYAMIAYLTEEWGYSEEFLEQQLPLFSEIGKQVDITDVINRYIGYANGNPDCDLSAMHKYTMEYLETIVKADDVVTNEEQAALEAVNDIFIKSYDNVKLKSSILEAKKTLTQSATKSTDLFIGSTKKLKSKITDGGSQLVENAASIGEKSASAAIKTREKAVSSVNGFRKKGAENFKSVLSNTSEKVSALSLFIKNKNKPTKDS